MTLGYNNQHGPGWDNWYLPLNGQPLNAQVVGGFFPVSEFSGSTDRDHANSRFGNPMFGARMFGYSGEVYDVAGEQATTGDYRIELRESDGTLIEKVTRFWEAQWIDETNNPGSLVFTVHREDITIASYVFPNEVWLYRGMEPYARRKFIVQESHASEEEGVYLTVTCEGLMSQLAREQIEDYNAAGTPSTVEAIIRDWLADHQNLLPNIQVGDISASIGDTVFAASIPTGKEITILSALRMIHDSIGGFFYVTPGRRLVWKIDIGNNVGHIIRFGKNAARVGHYLDYRKIQNRLIGRAKNFAGADLTVTRTDATSIAAYGQISGVFNPGFDVENSAALTILTDNELTRRANPSEKWDVGAIDLSHTDRYEYDWEALAMEPGSTLRVIGSDFDISTKVFKITRDLSNPVAVILEVGDTSGGVGTDVSYKRDAGIIEAIVDAIRYVQRQRIQGV